MKPGVLSVSYQRGRALVVASRFICGHTESDVFQQAPGRASRRKIVEWIFGPRADERCAAAGAGCWWRTRLPICATTRRIAEPVSTATTICSCATAKDDYRTAVEWSEGFDIAEHRCDLCDGAGTLRPIWPAWRSSRSGAPRPRRRCCGSSGSMSRYLATSRRRLTDPPLAEGTRPSSYPETWRRYLDEVTADLPGWRPFDA